MNIAMLNIISFSTVKYHQYTIEPYAFAMPLRLKVHMIPSVPFSKMMTADL